MKVLISSRSFGKINSGAIDILKNNGVIVYPTDTIYGFGCDITSKTAIERIYKIKQKKAIGFSFIVPDLKEIAKYAIVSDYAYKIMKRLLPGPYTFIFKATKLVPKQLIPQKRTVAIRIPDNKVCLDIIKMLGNPILTTSANVSGEPHFSDPLEIITKGPHDPGRVLRPLAPCFVHARTILRGKAYFFLSNRT